jgi:hemolysin D
VPLAIMLATAAGLVWAVIGEVDIVAASPGTVVPSGRVKVIQPPEQRVVRHILVREGQRVVAGQPLLEFEDADLRADRDRIAGELVAARLSAARLRATLAGADGIVAPDGAPRHLVENERLLLLADRVRIEGEAAALCGERARLAASRDGIEATIAKLEAVLPLVRRRVEARRTLADRQVVSMTDFLELQEELLTLEADLRIERAALREAEAAIAAADARLDQVTRTHRLDTATARVEAETRATSLAEELRKAERRLAALDLRAPEDGTVHELALHTVGAVVQATQPLMKVAGLQQLASAMAWFEADSGAAEDAAPPVPPDLIWMQAELDEPRMPAA